jgi:uncharacterized protein YcbX
MVSGTVVALWRWPVKSMAGEPLASTRMDARGLGGDRTHAVTVPGGALLTAREAPRLLAWRAAYPLTADASLRPADPPPATVSAPGGRSFRWGDPRLRHALADDLGRQIELLRDPEGIQDLRRSVLVTFEATRRALEEELGAPVDVRRFRPNLHVEAAAPAWAELGWQGGALRLAGGVRLRFLHPCTRCAIPTRDPDTQEKWPAVLRRLDVAHDRRFGLNARVEVAGRVALGERAEIAPPPADA